MKKQTKEKIEDLRNKIVNRISKDDIPFESGLSAKTLQTILHETFDGYNAILVDRVDKNIKKLNRNIFASKVLKKKVPYIYSMTPTIDENGNETIELLFTCDKKCKGMGRVHKDMSIEVDFLIGDYSLIDTLELLGTNFADFASYFHAMDSFKEEFPGFEYKWGRIFSSQDSIQSFNDGFMRANFNLNDLNNTRIELSSDEDKKLANIRTAKYGELSDLVYTYNDTIKKTFEINEEELNPLYKTAVDKYRENNRYYVNDNRYPLRELRVK